jgi:hypothetical protein
MVVKGAPVWMARGRGSTQGAGVCVRAHSGGNASDREFCKINAPARTPRGKERGKTRRIWSDGFGHHFDEPPFVPLLTLNVRQLISPPPQLLCATQGLADYQAKLSNAKDDYERASAQIGIEVCSAMNHALGNV